MKKLVCIIAAAISMISVADDGWEILESKDEMTDDAIYTIMRLADEETRIDEFSSYRAALCVRLTVLGVTESGGLKCKQELFFHIEVDGLRRGSTTVTLRFDSDKAYEEEWDTGVTRRGAFSPKAVSTIAKLRKAKMLRIRYVTTMGAVRTVKFTLDGLSEKLQEVKKRHNGKSETSPSK